MPMSINRVTADGASSVCSVESTRWPVCAACIAILAVSWSRISPTRMTSGSCRRIDAQRARERQLDLLVDLRLVDAGNLILDRIFDRDDVGALGLHRRQRRAERRRLAAAGRADDEDHAVLVLEEEAASSIARRGREAELFERRDALAVIEDAHARSSRRSIVRSVETRKSTSLPSSVVDADAAVLRQALLGDVHAAP